MSAGPEEAHAAEFPYWRRNKITVASGNLLSNMGWSLAFAFLPLIVQDMNVGNGLELWVGLISFAYFGTSCLFTPVWGVLADHYGRKSMVVRAGVGLGVGFLVASRVHDPALMLVTMMAVGLANGYVPAGTALIATNTPRSRVGGALALAQSSAWLGNTIGPVVGAVLIGLVARPGDLMAISGVCTLTAGIMAITLLKETHVPPTHRVRFNMVGDVRRLWRVPQLKPLYLMYLVFSFSVSGANAVISLITIRMIGDDEEYAGFDLGFWIAAPVVGFTVVSVVMLPVWGRLLNYREPSRMITLQLGGSAVTGVLLLLSRNPFELTVARVLFAMWIIGLAPTLVQMVRDRAPVGMEARTLSYGTAVQQMGAAIAPLVASVMAPVVGLRAYFLLVIAMVIVAIRLWRRSTPGAAGPRGRVSGRLHRPARARQAS